MSFACCDTAVGDYPNNNQSSTENENPVDQQRWRRIRRLRRCKEGTTVSEMFEQKIPHAKASDYLIRVNRQPTARDGVLQEGDRVSCTPVKIEGANR